MIAVCTYIYIHTTHKCDTYFFNVVSESLSAPFCGQDLSKGTLFGVKHFLALSIASLFLKLKSACSVAAREDTEEEANW